MKDKDTQTEVLRADLLKRLRERLIGLQVGRVRWGKGMFGWSTNEGSKAKREAEEDKQKMVFRVLHPRKRVFLVAAMAGGTWDELVGDSVVASPAATLRVVLGFDDERGAFLKEPVCPQKDGCLVCCDIVEDGACRGGHVPSLTRAHQTSRYGTGYTCGVPVDASNGLVFDGPELGKMVYPILNSANCLLLGGCFSVSQIWQVFGKLDQNGMLCRDGGSNCFPLETERSQLLLTVHYFKAKRGFGGDGWIIDVLNKPKNDEGCWRFSTGDRLFLRLSDEVREPLSNVCLMARKVAGALLHKLSAPKRRPPFPGVLGPGILAPLLEEVTRDPHEMASES